MNIHVVLNNSSQVVKFMEYKFVIVLIAYIFFTDNRFRQFLLVVQQQKISNVMSSSRKSKKI